MANELTREDTKALYEYASNAFTSGNLLHAIPLLERVVSLDHPLYKPFALSSLASIYKRLHRTDLEIEAVKQITMLPEEQRALLDPRWLAGCFVRTGDFKTAKLLLTRALALVPDDPRIMAALAEVSLFDGEVDRAEALASKIAEFGDPPLQVLGRTIRAFSFALRGMHEKAAADFQWVGQYFVSIGSIPLESWDYRDLQRLDKKTGPNAKMADLLMNALTGQISPQKFTQVWTETIAPRSTA